jgi:hypothetical protein
VTWGHDQKVPRDPLTNIRWRGAAPLQVGVIGRRTELVLITSAPGPMRIVSPHELPAGET